MAATVDLREQAFEELAVWDRAGRPEDAVPAGLLAAREYMGALIEVVDLLNRAGQL